MGHPLDDPTIGCGDQESSRDPVSLPVMGLCRLDGSHVRSRVGNVGLLIAGYRQEGKQTRLITDEVVNA